MPFYNPIIWADTLSYEVRNTSNTPPRKTNSSDIPLDKSKGHGGHFQTKMGQPRFSNKNRKKIFIGTF